MSYADWYSVVLSTLCATWIVFVGFRIKA